MSGKKRRSTSVGSVLADFFGLFHCCPAVDHRGDRPAQRGMAKILVVVDLQGVQQLAQMVETANHQPALDPLVLQGEDDALRHRDGAMLADGAEPLPGPVSLTTVCSSICSCSFRGLPTTYSRSRDARSHQAQP